MSIMARGPGEYAHRKRTKGRVSDLPLISTASAVHALLGRRRGGEDYDSGIATRLRLRSTKSVQVQCLSSASRSFAIMTWRYLRWIRSLRHHHASKCRWEEVYQPKGRLILTLQSDKAKTEHARSCTKCFISPQCQALLWLHASIMESWQGWLIPAVMLQQGWRNVFSRPCSPYNVRWRLGVLSYRANASDGCQSDS